MLHFGRGRRNLRHKAAEFFVDKRHRAVASATRRSNRVCLGAMRESRSALAEQQVQWGDEVGKAWVIGRLSDCAIPLRACLTSRR